MNSDNKFDFAIASFSSLETQLITFMEYVPYIDNNKKVISPKFVPIIVDACSLIDSIFREITDDDTERYSLKKYCEIHETYLSLEGNISLFLVSPLQLLEPYAVWTKEQPDWWAAYNALKHDRLNNYEVATYVNAVLSLAGLHQLMARCKMFIGGFLRAGWIDTENNDLIGDLGSAAHLAGLHSNPPSMVIESKLFVTPTVENFLTRMSDDPEFFDVDYDVKGLSNRVRNFLFAHEDWG